jgi:hypothetical protein
VNLCRPSHPHDTLTLNHLWTLGEHFGRIFKNGVWNMALTTGEQTAATTSAMRELLDIQLSRMFAAGGPCDCCLPLYAACEAMLSLAETNSLASS